MTNETIQQVCNGIRDEMVARVSETALVAQDAFHLNDEETTELAFVMCELVLNACMRATEAAMALGTCGLTSRSSGVN